MSVYVDSSVIVRYVAAAHEDNAAVKSWLQALAARTEIVTSTHALAEVFKVISTLFRYPPAQSLSTITSIRRTFRIVTLLEAQYVEAIELTLSKGFAGGAVYDALHIAAAARAGATRVASCDERSFPRMLPPSRFVNPLKP